MATNDDAFENSEGIPQINGKKPRNTFLDLFSKLTSVNQKIRLKSGCQIVRHLEKNGENKDELQYTIRRLVKGLGASKTNARIGFFTTFTVLLQHSSNIDVNTIFHAVQKELKPSRQNLKSENADIYTGLILVCGALLQTGKFDALEDENQKILLQLMVEASDKKCYLGLLAASIIIDSLPKLKEKTFSTIILPVIRPQLKKQLNEYTIDQLYLLLKLEEHFPTIINPKFLQNLIETPKIITEGTVKSLVQVLLEVQPSKKISLHPIYAHIGRLFASCTFLPKILQRIDFNFDSFAYVKHQVVAVLLKHIVDNLQPDDTHIPDVFGKNFVTETVKHFKTTTSKQNDHIKTAVVNLLNSTALWAKRSENNDETKVKLIEKVIFYPGIFIFEKITGNKILQNITASLNVAGVNMLSKIYKGVLLAETKKMVDDSKVGSWLNLDRVYAAQLIVKLINHPVMRTEHDWKVDQLAFLMEVALLKRQDIGVDLQKSLKETFFSALDFKVGKLQDIISCLSKLVHNINENMAGENIQTPLKPEVQELWDTTIEYIDELEEKTKESHLTQVFHTLFLQMSFQLFNDEKLAADSLKELFSCYSKRKAKDEELHWVEVVVDLFLNLLSHNSHLLRGVINKVFPHLCEHLTASALHQILHVLDPKSNSNPLEDVDTDDDSDGDEEEDDEDGQADEEEEDSDEDDEDMDYEEDETHNDKLRQALHDALMQSTKDDDNDSVDLDDMSDSEADKLNSALSEAFKQFRPKLKQKSTKQSKDDQTLTHFRVRTMDLIDIYLESPEVTMINCLEIMLPLLQCLEFSIRDSHQKPLYDRIKSSLKKLTTLKTFSSVKEVNEDVLYLLLQSILDKGTKSVLLVQEMGDKTAECCMFIINCSSLIGATKKISALLVEVLDTFFKKRNCLTPYALFKMVLNSNWERSITLVSPLMNYVFTDEIRPFRKRQSLELLKIFYLNNRLIAANKDSFSKKLIKCEGKLKSNIVDFLEMKEYKSKEPFVIGLFLLLTSIKNCCHGSQAFDWVKIGMLARDYRSGISLTSDGKQAFNRLCHALKVSNIVKMQKQIVKLNFIKQEARVDSEVGDEEEVVVEKKKGKKEAKKLKKEANLLRMQSLSEGLSRKFNFNQAGSVERHPQAVENGDGTEEEPQRNGKVTKRKKVRRQPSESAETLKKRKKK